MTHLLEYVCVCERERERLRVIERERERYNFLWLKWNEWVSNLACNIVREEGFQSFSSPSSTVSCRKNKEGTQQIINIVDNKLVHRKVVLFTQRL